MLRTTTIAMILGASLTAVQAAPIKLSLSQIGEVLQGLSSLDGYKDEKGQTIYYHFGGAPRLVIAHDMAVLRRVVADYQAAYQIMEADAAQAADKAKAQEHLRAENAKLLAAKQDIDLARIRVGDLDLEKNLVPPSVLSLVWPILEDAPAAIPSK